MYGGLSTLVSGQSWRPVRSSFAIAGWRAAAFSVGLSLCAHPLAAQEAPKAGGPLEVRGEFGRVVFGIEAGLQIVGEKSAFWNLSNAYPGAKPFNPNLYWSESYVTPSLSFGIDLARSVTAYGGLSMVGSGTLNEDVYGAGNTARTLPENFFAGVRIAGPVSFDISGGSQPYQIGSGMLIQAGASNGFERGALVFSPRVAWARTAIARAAAGPVTAEAFYLSPNDLASNPTDTQMAGANLFAAWGNNEILGAAYGRVLTSQVPSVQAAAGPGGSPQLIANGRQGLQYVNAYGRWNPLRSINPGFWVAGDLALERNDAIDLRAWAGRAEIGQSFPDWAWRPSVSYAVAAFSGDNPGTARNERFDPLYFNGGPGAWASEGNASFIFINSNLNIHRVTLALNPSPQDIVNPRYWRTSANQLLSPLQFGQATRFSASGASPGVIAGVGAAHLSDGVLAEYTRVLNAHTFATVGVAASSPGEGIRALQNGAGPLWLGGFANLVVKY